MYNLCTEEEKTIGLKFKCTCVLIIVVKHYNHSLQVNIYIYITALLGVHWMLGIWIDRHRILRSVEVCGDFPLPTDDEATQELRNLDLGGN